METIRDTTDTNVATVDIHALLNEATELLHYASSLNDLFGELIHEPGIIDSQRLSSGLGAIKALTRMSQRCLREAHEHMTWERAAAMKVPLIDATDGNGARPRSQRRRGRSKRP